MKDTAAIVVTYNRKALLLECLGCILDQREYVPDILVIDNASSDGTEAALRPLIEAQKVRYYNTGANLGGAGGFQYGIRKAVELGYDDLWIMDDDCMPSQTALSALRSAAAELGDRFGFLSSKALWQDGSICRMNVQRRTLTKNVADYAEPLIPAVMASFVSLYVPARVVRELGLPIKEFFIWTDDWEYTRRISRKHPCYVVSGSVVVHKSKANIPADIASDSRDRLDRYRYLYRNDVYLYRREGLRGFAYECARLALHCLRVLRRAPDGKRKRLGMILGGTKEGFRFHPQIEYAQRTEEAERL